MARAQVDPISFQRNVILGLLLVLAAAAWAELVWQGAEGDMAMAMDSPTMGLRAPLFLAIWVIMMVAMMFPTAAPMIVTFHKVQAGKRQRGEAFVSTWIFVGAYLLEWGLSGVVAYAGALEVIAALASALMRATIAAKPLERCGVKCSRKPNSSKIAAVSVARISRGVRPDNSVSRIAISPRTICASLSPR